MNLTALINMPAKDSVLFWVFVGTILAVVLVIVLRDLFLWYFGIHEMRARIDELTEQVRNLSGGVRHTNAPSPATNNDAEIAAAIIAAMKCGK